MRTTYLYQLNLTRDCNLRCAHCYISSAVKRLSGRMTGESLVRIGRGIAEHMASIGYDHAEVHVIGGEPTMLGLAFFDEHMPALREALAGRGFSFEIILVSNLLSRDIVRIARHFDRVNTSWEVGTRFPKPRTEEAWRGAVRALRDGGTDVGVTTAVTLPVVRMGARAVLDHHYAQGIRQVHFGFFIPSGDGLANLAEVFPPFAETSRFLVDAATWYLERRDADPSLFVNPPESMLAAIDRGEPLDDVVCPIIAGSMDIDWNGKAVTCLEAGGEREVEWLGDVLATSVADVAGSLAFRRQVRLAAKPRRACMTCEEYPVCRSGCGVNHRFWRPDADEDCPGFKGFIKHMRSLHAAGLRPRDAGYRGRVAF